MGTCDVRYVDRTRLRRLAVFYPEAQLREEVRWLLASAPKAVAEARDFK